MIPTSFFFNATATTEIYTLSLHDALPIFVGVRRAVPLSLADSQGGINQENPRDRKSTRLNSSHTVISYAVFCLKKKTTVSALIHAATIVTSCAYMVERSNALFVLAPTSIE